MRRRLSKADQVRRREIIKALSDMSRHGWQHYAASDYLPLERELAQIQTRLDISNKEQRQ